MGRSGLHHMHVIIILIFIVNNIIIMIYFMCISYVLKTAEYTTIDLYFNQCDFSVDDAVALLKGVGDRQLSLIVLYVVMYYYCACIMSHHCSSYSTTVGVMLYSQCWKLSVLSQCLV